MDQLNKAASSRATDTGLAALFWALGALCVAPVLAMLAGVFSHSGRLSTAHLAVAFSDPDRILILLWNSLAVTGGTVGLALCLGVPVGFLCFRTDLPLRRWIVLGCLLAACIPAYVTATCWMALLGMQFWLYRTWGAAWISGLTYTPLVALITGAGFTLVDRELEDTATLDTGFWGVFRHASLPLGAWSVGIAAVVVALLSVWDITITDILMIRTFAEEIFTQFQLTGEPWTAMAVSLPMLLVAGILSLIVGRLVWQRGKQTSEGMLRRPALIALGWKRYPLLCLVFLGFAACFGLPTAALLRSLGSIDNLVTAWRTASPELLATLRLSPLAATICVALAVPAAWAALKTRVARWIVGGCLLLLLAAPAPIVGIGIIKLLNRPGPAGWIYDTEVGIVLAYVIRALPFGVLALLPAFQRIPRELEELVEIDGGGWTRKIAKAAVPTSWPALVAAWSLCLVITISEMGASFLVVPPGKATLSIRFFTLIHYGVYPDAAGICLLLLVLLGLAAVVIATVLWPILARRMA